MKGINPSGPPSHKYYLTTEALTSSAPLGGRWSFTNGYAGSGDCRRADVFVLYRSSIVFSTYIQINVRCYQVTDFAHSFRSAIKHNPSGLCVDNNSAARQDMQITLVRCNGTWIPAIHVYYE